MWIVPIVMAILALILAQPVPAQWMTLDHQGRERHYLLRAPAQSTGALPLVLVFHGGSDTPQNMEKISGFTELAMQRGFIVAYPEGLQKNWADGRGATPPDRQGVDDV